MGDPRFQVVHFFIKWTFHLCDTCVCLIRRKCCLEIWDHSLNPNPFSRVKLPPTKKPKKKKKPTKKKKKKKTRKKASRSYTSN